MMNYIKVKKPMLCDNDRPTVNFLVNTVNPKTYYEWVPETLGCGRTGAWVCLRASREYNRMTHALERCQEPDNKYWKLIADMQACTLQLDNSGYYPELLAFEGPVLVGRPGRTKEVIVRTTTFPLRSGYYTSAMTVIEELADGKWKKVGQIYDRDANHPTVPINNWQTLRCNVKTPFAGAREYILEATKDVLKKKHKNIDLAPLDSGFAQV